MIHMQTDEFDKIMSFTDKNQAVGTLIAALVEDYEGACRQVEYFRQKSEKAEKKIKSLEKKLGMWDTLKKKN